MPRAGWTGWTGPKISLGPKACVSQTLKKIKISLGPEAYVSQTLKKVKISLGPEAYVSPELEKTQYFAWARRLSTHTYIYIYL